MPMADRQMGAWGPLRSIYEDLNPRTNTLGGDFKEVVKGRLQGWTLSQSN